MSRPEKIIILIAESAPVISSGLTYCIRRLPGMQTQVIAVGKRSELDSYMQSTIPDIIAVDPSFDGIFNPMLFRENFKGDYKLLGIQGGQYSPSTMKLFDGTISLFDDLQTIADTIRGVLSLSEKDDDSRETLSQREKEIVEWVVKGLTNKEIAEKLYLSPHTVMTHRRNIARKLEIHSATGLTIYAIVNHIVDISELNL